MSSQRKFVSTGNEFYTLDTIKKINELFLKDVSGEVSDIRTPKEKRIWEYAL